jgi:hypothetical protein
VTYILIIWIVLRAAHVAYIVNKIDDIGTTLHRGTFGQPLLPWKRESALHFYCLGRKCGYKQYKRRPASCSSGQSFWLLIMRSRVRFPVLPWDFSLKGEDSHGDHGVGSLVELRLRPHLLLNIHISPSTSSGQRNCASWVSQPQKSVTLRPQPGGETTKSIRDMWWHWWNKKNVKVFSASWKCNNKFCLRCCLATAYISYCC